MLNLEPENINQEKAIRIENSEEAVSQKVLTPWTGQKWSKYSEEILPCQDVCDEPEVEDKTVWSGQIWSKYV